MPPIVVVLPTKQPDFNDPVM